MANVIQSLMVLIGGDSGGLEGALGTADQTLKGFGLSFSSIIKGMSFSALIVGAIEAGKTFEEASIQMQRATGASGAALEGMEENFKKLYATSTQSGEAIAGALSQISQKTGATGDALEHLTKSELEFAKVTGSDLKTAVDTTQKLFAQWKVATEDQSSALDVLYVATQKSGLTADQLNASMLAMGPTLRNVGFSFVESTALVGAFGKAGLDASDMTAGLNKAFIAFAAAGKSPKEALISLVDQMASTETRTQALTLAIDAGFTSKVAGRFVDAVKSGSFNLADFKKALEESGGSVTDMAKKTTTLGAEFTKLCRTLNVELAPAGQAILSFATKSVQGWAIILHNLKDTGAEIEAWAKAHPIAATALGLINPAMVGFLPHPTPSTSQVGEGKSTTRSSRTGALVAGPGPGEEENFVFNPKTGSFESQKGPLKPPIPESLKTPPPGSGDAGGGAPASTATDKANPWNVLSDSLAVFIAQEQIEIATKKSLIQETAAYNEATGASYKPIDLLRMKTAEATWAAMEFGGVWDDTSPKVETNTLAMAKTFDEGAKTLKTFAGGIMDAAQAALDTSPYGQLEAAFGTLHLSVNSLTGDLENKLVSGFKTVAGSSLSTSNQVAESWGAASGSINKLAKSDLPGAVSAYQAYIDALKRTGAAIGDIYDAQEKLLTLEIHMRQQRGVSSASQIVQLTNVQMRTEALKTISAGLGPIYKGLMGAFDNAFKTLGNNLVAGIMQTKKWGEVWRDTLKSIATDILTVVIQAILKMVEAWIIGMITKKAASTVTAVGETTGNIAIAATGAASAMAGIPLVGPALALAAAASMTAILSAIYIPMATFEHGGRVPYDMMTMVHKGEYFLPAHETAMAAAGGGGGGVVIDMRNSNFTGVTQDLVTTVLNKGIAAARRAGAKI